MSACKPGDGAGNSGDCRTWRDWAVIALGVALSITFSSPEAPPLVLVGVLILFFLALETRRYRYFNVWRAPARWLE